MQLCLSKWGKESLENSDFWYKGQQKWEAAKTESIVWCLLPTLTLRIYARAWVSQEEIRELWKIRKIRGPIWWLWQKLCHHEKESLLGFSGKSIMWSLSWGLLRLQCHFSTRRRACKSEKWEVASSAQASVILVGTGVPVSVASETLLQNGFVGNISPKQVEFDMWEKCLWASELLSRTLGNN